MDRYFVREDGPHFDPPYSRSGCYRVWDGLRREAIREIHWFEQRGVPIDDGGKTLSQKEAHERATTDARTRNEAIDAAEAYRRRK